MFSALAEGHGQLANKINLFIALCPITNLAYSSNGLINFGANPVTYGTLENTLKTFNY